MSTPGYGSTVQGIGFETLVVNGTPTTEIVTDGSANGGIVPEIQSAIVRYNLNGSLDPTFGTGGVVINPYVHARAIAILPDGQIVEAGGALSSPTASVVTEFAVARYNTDGSLDTTFNPSGSIPGIAMVGNGTTPAGVRGMAIEPSDGSIIVAGVSEPSGAPTHTALACFNADGSVNTNFGSGGFLVQVLSSLGDTASRRRFRQMERSSRRARPMLRADIRTSSSPGSWATPRRPLRVSPRPHSRRTRRWRSTR